MKIFKKYSLVPTGIIKQYIVDEFTRANNLDKDKRELIKTNKDLSKIITIKNEEIGKANLVVEQMKYKYGKAQENYNNDLESKNKEINKLENSLIKEKEKCNTFQIKIIELQKKIDELKKETKIIKKKK